MLYFFLMVLDLSHTRISKLDRSRRIGLWFEDMLVRRYVSVVRVAIRAGWGIRSVFTGVWEKLSVLVELVVVGEHIDGSGGERIGQARQLCGGVCG